MNDDGGTAKIRQEDLKRPPMEEEDNLTGEEIERLADLFASAPPDDEEDTGPFRPVSDEDTGPFKPVND